MVGIINPKPWLLVGSSFLFFDNQVSEVLVSVLGPVQNGGSAC